MATTDTTFVQLADLYPEIAARRRTDQTFDEICGDYEELVRIATLFEPTTDKRDDSLQKDTRATIQALREEIRIRLQNS
jgi:hypothetical protein